MVAPAPDYSPRDDALYQHYERLWYEIRRLLPYHRRLALLDGRRSPSQERQLRVIEAELRFLRQRTRRYAEVFRAEAWPYDL